MMNLSHLNEFVRQIPFKMETVASVLLSVQEGDFLVSINLKDAYFRIPVHQSSRKLLRFVSEGTVYQFKALCFILSTAPQVFTRMFATVSAWAHSHGIRLLRYLDDWLVLASSEEEARQHVRALLLLCHSLEIVINEERWTESLDVHLNARYLPGQSNVLADLLSCRDQVIGTEWSLHPQVARDLRRWGSPSIDLFATSLNAKLPLYCSLVPVPQAVIEDAFHHH